MIIRTRDNLATVRAKLSYGNALGVSERRGERLTGFGIPNAGRIVLGSGNDPRPVRTKLNRINGAGVLQRLDGWAAGSCIPNASGVIGGSGGNTRPVRAKF